MINKFDNLHSPYIRSPGWLKGLPENMYIELLCCIAENQKGLSTHLQNAILLKYVCSSNNTDLESVENVSFYEKNYLSSKESNILWLTKWYEKL